MRMDGRRAWRWSVFRPASQWKQATRGHRDHTTQAPFWVRYRKASLQSEGDVGQVEALLWQSTQR